VSSKHGAIDERKDRQSGRIEAAGVYDPQTKLTIVFNKKYLRRSSWKLSGALGMASLRIASPEGATSFYFFAEMARDVST
jgi:hypothetical protein